MIKSENGIIEVDGIRPMVQMDLIMIFKSLMSDDAGFTEDDVLKALEISKLSDDELEEALEEEGMEFMEELKGLMEALKDVASGYETMNVEFPYKKRR